MPKHYYPERKFGSRYTWHTGFQTNSKSVANDRAKKERHGGNKARIVKFHGTWHVLTKSKGSI